MSDECFAKKIFLFSSLKGGGSNAGSRDGKRGTL